jgi:MOSC domain-containing protein YiiM
LSGIFKRPVAGPVLLAKLGLNGDEQADRRYHGGADKAVNVYPQEHFAYWEEKLGQPLEPGAFGEDFSTRGLVEDETCIGDTYQVGAAVVQVTQPRQPCWNLASKHHEPELVRWVIESRKTGFYMRCLKPGSVQAGDLIKLVNRPANRVTISEANRIMIDAKHDLAAINRLLAVTELSDACRSELARRRARE